MNKFVKTVGSRAEVWHGVAKKTTGGLEKKDLFKNKNGNIVSKKKHFTASKERRLEKYGYFAKKGVFGYVKKRIKNDNVDKKNKTNKAVKKNKSTKSVKKNKSNKKK